MSKNILIAYFTHSGNTGIIANLIHNIVGGITFEVQPEVSYSNSYNMVVEQAKKEIKAGYKPVLKTNLDSIEVYDTVFVGSPNWWSTIAPPIATFLSDHDWSGKTIVPFCTHGGGGQAQVIKDIAKLCPGAAVLDGFDVYGSGSAGDTQAQISAWLHKISVI
ncbi:flavodoxin [Clostridium carboxidivorans P7]|uniref:Flavodoxin-like domain-containing protein n=2 Tax=Clostridium TaxID=1485 RepID=C6PRU0_9CLOT|nr:flavodoxin [Clostridium carboxidivorans P7]EET87992.1 conserved hypothetical protein [Clostridium carboxidivorans P7]EFG89054.1 flavodoxin family protein [Clostridium carboxidivorans P7]